MTPIKEQKKIELRCIEPNCEYITKKSPFAKQELGRHLRFVHGIAGASSSAAIMQKKKAPTITTSKIANGEYMGDTTSSVAAEAPKRSYKKRDPLSISGGALSNGEAIALITVGRIQAYCEIEAKKYGISEIDFTLRCSQLFYASQVRK